MPYAQWRRQLLEVAGKEGLGAGSRGRASAKHPEAEYANLKGARSHALTLNSS